MNPAPATLSGLDFNPSSVVGGQQNSIVTVSVSNPAPAGGETLSLYSSNACVSVPSSVTLPEGQTSAQLTATTSAVSKPTTVEIPVQDTYGDQITGFLSVNPVTPVVQRFAIAPSFVTSGGSVNATIMINSANPNSDTTIAISNSCSENEISVPSTVTVPAGQTSVQLTIGTSPIATQDTATIIATLNGTSPPTRSLT